MDRKAQGLSLNTIIVAIIVLIVLVVLIMVFTGYFGTRFTPQVTSCANAGGICTSGDAGCGNDAFGSPLRQISATCPVETQVCCAKGLGSGGKITDYSGYGVQGANCRPLDQFATECDSGLECSGGTCQLVEESATQPACSEVNGACKGACDTTSETQSSSGICEEGAVCCLSTL